MFNYDVRMKYDSITLANHPHIWDVVYTENEVFIRVDPKFVDTVDKELNIGTILIGDPKSFSNLNITGELSLLEKTKPYRLVIFKKIHQANSGQLVFFETKTVNKQFFEIFSNLQYFQIYHPSNPLPPLEEFPTVLNNHTVKHTSKKRGFSDKSMANIIADVNYIRADYLPVKDKVSLPDLYGECTMCYLVSNVGFQISILSEPSETDWSQRIYTMNGKFFGDMVVNFALNIRTSMSISRSILVGNPVLTGGSAGMFEYYIDLTIFPSIDLEVRHRTSFIGTFLSAFDYHYEFDFSLSVGKDSSSSTFKSTSVGYSHSFPFITGTAFSWYLESNAISVNDNSNIIM